MVSGTDGPATKKRAPRERVGFGGFTVSEGGCQSCVPDGRASGIGQLRGRAGLQGLLDDAAELCIRAGAWGGLRECGPSTMAPHWDARDSGASRGMWVPERIPTQTAPNLLLTHPLPDAPALASRASAGGDLHGSEFDLSQRRGSTSVPAEAYPGPLPHPCAPRARLVAQSSLSPLSARTPSTPQSVSFRPLCLHALGGPSPARWAARQGGFSQLRAGAGVCCGVWAVAWLRYR